MMDLNKLKGSVITIGGANIIVVDAVCFYLYIVKGIPFKAGLYGLYVIIAVAGYFKWKKMMKKS